MKRLLLLIFVIGIISGEVDGIKFLVINGPNLNMLGMRDSKQYGTEILEEINTSLKSRAEAEGHQLVFYQSNHEGEIVDRIHEAVKTGDFAGMIINAGALTHYSYSVRDAIELMKIPVVEVHMSNVFKREEFRRKSVLSDVVTGVISGFGSFSYHLALEVMFRSIQ